MNCIIIHGTPGKEEKAMPPEKRFYNRHWMLWIKRELEKKGWQVAKPDMPNPWKKVYNNYKKEFEKYGVNENTVLIGHSSGCAFLVRWLGESKQKVKKLILVAPYKITHENNKFEKAFYKFDVDESIRDRVEEIIMFTADNESVDGKKSLRIFHSSLGGKIIELKAHGHYTLKSMGTEEFPELLREILN